MNVRKGSRGQQQEKYDIIHQYKKNKNFHRTRDLIIMVIITFAILFSMLQGLDLVSYALTHVLNAPPYFYLHVVNFVVGNQIHENFSDSRYSHYERNFEICSTPQEMKMTRRMTSNFSFFFSNMTLPVIQKYFTDYYVRSFISMLFTTML